MTKHRQQSTKVRAKGIDSIWSQVCSSLLQLLLANGATTGECFESFVGGMTQRDLCFLLVAAGGGLSEELNTINSRWQEMEVCYVFIDMYLL